MRLTTILFIKKALYMIKYKCWYYDEAIKDGTEKRIKNITANQMPNEIKKYYDIAHE